MKGPFPDIDPREALEPGSSHVVKFGWGEEEGPSMNHGEQENSTKVQKGKGV